MSNTQHNSQRMLPSEQLAALIIDALIDAEILEKQHLQRAIKIAAEEIEARKA